MKKSVSKKNNQNFFRSRMGQVTVFVIVAVILVAVGGVALFVTKDSNRPDDAKFFSAANSKPELSNIRSSLLACRDSSVKTALDTIGVQGGYSDKPSKALDLGWTFIPYYYLEGKYILPARIDVEKELGKQVDKDFTKCINDLKFEGFTIDKKTPKTKATIKRSEVDVTIDMAVSIKQGESVIALEMKDAPTVLNSSLFEIMEITEYITMSHKNDSKMICITCLAQMAEERNVYINSFDLVNNSVLFVISENHTAEEPYSFEFLNMYPAVESVNINTPNAPSAPKTAG